HEKHEKVQVAEEAVVAAFMLHVAGGIDVNQQADERNGQQHHDRELIHLERKIHAKRACGDPREIVPHPRYLAGRQLHKFAHQLSNCHERERHRTDRNGIHRSLRPIVAQKAVDGGARQRQRENDPEMIEYEHQNLSRFTRSTLSDWRFCAMVRMMARPTADSAAATTITKRTNTSPSSWLCARAKATNA